VYFGRRRSAGWTCAGEQLASRSRPRSASSPAANSRESSTAGSVGLCDDGSRARVGRVINCESAVKTRRSQWFHAEREPAACRHKSIHYPLPSPLLSLSLSLSLRRLVRGSRKLFQVGLGTPRRRSPYFIDSKSRPAVCSAVALHSETRRLKSPLSPLSDARLRVIYSEHCARLVSSRRPQFLPAKF